MASGHQRGEYTPEQASLAMFHRGKEILNNRISGGPIHGWCSCLVVETWLKPWLKPPAKCSGTGLEYSDIPHLWQNLICWPRLPFQQPSFQHFTQPSSKFAFSSPCTLANFKAEFRRPKLAISLARVLAIACFSDRRWLLFVSSFLELDKSSGHWSARVWSTVELVVLK